MPRSTNRLLDTLTINVTDFYRDETVYDILRTQVDTRDHQGEDALAPSQRSASGRRGARRARKPYSVTMAFLSVLGQHAPDFLLTVFATDIDPGALQKARSGHVRHREAAAHTRSRTRCGYLEKSEQTFKVKPEVTQHVKFRSLNLFEDEPINILDVILCRNVFIYFTREQQAKVLERLLAGAPQGRATWCSAGARRWRRPWPSRFELVSGRERVYRKPYNGRERRED